MKIVGRPLADHIKLLVIKNDKTGLDHKEIESLKTILDPLIPHDISEVFDVQDFNSVQLLNKKELAQYTHVISNSIDFPQYKVLTDELLIPVVTSEWLHLSVKKKSVASTKPFSPDPRNFFRCVSLATTSSLNDDLACFMEASVKTFGGTFSHELKKTLTHLISLDSSDDSTKMIKAYNEVNTEGVNIHIVSPNWVTDSILLGQLLSEDDYSLDSRKKKQNIDIPEFVKGLKFKCAGDLSDLFTNLECEEAPELIITRFYDANVAIKQRSFDYLLALFKEKSTTLSKDSLLYFPHPKTPILGMKHLLFSITNYTGDARYYIEELITRMGGKCNKNLKASGTHLIAASSVGKKYEYANLWNIKVVNHTWIEDCFMNWELLDEDGYGKLPRIDENIRFIGDCKFNGFSKAVIPTDDVLNREVQVIDSGLTTQVSVKEPLCLSGTNYDANVEGEVATANSEVNTSKQVDQLLTPLKDSEETKTSDAKENKGGPLFSNTSNTVTRTTSENKRKYTVPACIEDNALTDIQDVEKLQPENKSTGLDQKIWEIPDEPIVLEDTSKGKRTAETDFTVTLRKKQATNKSTQQSKPYDIVAIVTGSNISISSSDKKELKKIGITIIENPTKNLNCIIAPSLLRTQKFITALSHDPLYFIEPLFLTDVLGTLDSVKKIGDFNSIAPKIEKYSIWQHINYEKDVVSKRLFQSGTTMVEAVGYMKRSREGLFDGFEFNISSGIAGGFDAVKSILKSYGAKTLNNFKDNSKVAVSNKTVKILGKSDVSILICGSNESRTREHFAKVCEKSSQRFITLEWDVIVTSIFEAAFNVTKDNVLEHHRVFEE